MRSLENTQENWEPLRKIKQPVETFSIMRQIRQGEYSLNMFQVPCRHRGLRYKQDPPKIIPPDERSDEQMLAKIVKTHRGNRKGQMKPARADTTNKFFKISRSPFQKTSEARSQDFPTTSEPPPENVGQKKLKGEPSIMDRGRQVFAERPRCCNTPCKKTMEICQPLQKVGVNFAGGGAASPTNPKKGCADKRKINVQTV